MRRKFLRFKKQKTQTNELLSDNLVYSGNSELPTRLQLIQYNAEYIEVAEVNSVEEFTQKRKENSICWLNVIGLKNVELISDIRQYFDLHILEMQDILNTNHIPKVEEYENNILLVVKALSVNENHELKKEQLSFVLGKDFLLTFQETDHAHFDNIKTALMETHIKARKKSTDYLMSLLFRNISDNYTFLTEQIEDTLEDMETTLMDFSNKQEDIGWQIQSLRKQYLSLKKVVMPLKESFAHLLCSDNELLCSENSAYLNDTYEHLLMVSQKIEICREMITSLLDLYVSNNDLKMNGIMKQLTIVGSIFIPLTFVAGVWGMNFSNMPELNLKYGYYYAWISMIVIGVFVWFYFKRKKWY